eukprot:m.4621 g.4621  ORF g.4621 m.4621 type:complete len:236 (-) comp3031_c0_seq1:4-711(-)
MTDYPNLVVASSGMDSANHWEARRRTIVNQRAEASQQQQLKTAKEISVEDFLVDLGITEETHLNIVKEQGIDTPIDFLNYSFAELISIGLLPAHAKRIKMACLQMKLKTPLPGIRNASNRPATSPAVLNHVPTYGAYDTMRKMSSSLRPLQRMRTAPPNPYVGRQDFVTLGRKDKAMMMEQVWGPYSTHLQHQPKARSFAYLASTRGVSDDYLRSSEFHSTVSDLKQARKGLMDV